MPVDQLEPAGVDDDRQVAREGLPGRRSWAVRPRTGRPGVEARADDPRLDRALADHGLGHGCLGRDLTGVGVPT